MTNVPLSVEEYVKQHDDKRYCESLVFPNGKVVDAIPSHQQALINLSGKSMKQLKEVCPLRASPLHWLSEHLNIAVVWYEQVIFPIGYTQKQIDTVKTLQRYNILYPILDIGISFEKTHVNYLETCNLDALYEYMDYVKERHDNLKEVFNVRRKSTGTTEQHH